MILYDFCNTIYNKKLRADSLRSATRVPGGEAVDHIVHLDKTQASIV